MHLPFIFFAHSFHSKLYFKLFQLKPSIDSIPEWLFFSISNTIYGLVRRVVNRIEYHSESLEMNFIKIYNYCGWHVFCVHWRKKKHRKTLTTPAVYLWFSTCEIRLFCPHYRNFLLLSVHLGKMDEIQNAKNGKWLRVKKPFSFKRSYHFLSPYMWQKCGRMAH